MGTPCTNCRFWVYFVFLLISERRNIWENFLNCLSFKEVKCKGKKKSPALLWEYCRATAIEDGLWEGCEFCSVTAAGTGGILMKNSSMGRAWKEGQQGTIRGLSSHSCEGNPGLPAERRMHLPHKEP